MFVNTSKNILTVVNEKCASRLTALPPSVRHSDRDAPQDPEAECRCACAPCCARKEPGFAHIFISTYFDGTSPPFTPSAPTNLANPYGITKHDGELAMLGVQDVRETILLQHRYGPAPSNTKSTVNHLLNIARINDITNRSHLAKLGLSKLWPGDTRTPFLMP
ncbi:hypothetical protein EDB92DRAFT_542816 [Lactarius akahatsu]|uniref:Uncharacterized protein n=1 Tax=Lactarius akahatsu TaxID=416441 RepID=A0AAD4QEF1_9AGAM|nr:hypothetical protein EDB92DRAFT_542816 [Lactarius akahatsu]